MMLCWSISSVLDPSICPVPYIISVWCPGTDLLSNFFLDLLQKSEEVKKINQTYNLRQGDGQDCRRVWSGSPGQCVYN